MSVGASLIQIHRALSDLSVRINGLEDIKNGGVSEDVLAKVVEAKLDALLQKHLAAKLEAQVDSRLDVRLEPMIDGKLDSKLESKLDVRVSTALKRERAFLEAVVADKVNKSVLDSVDIKWTTVRADMDTKNISRDSNIEDLLKRVNDLNARLDALSASPVAEAAVAPVESDPLPEPLSEVVPEEAVEDSPESTEVVPEATPEADFPVAVGKAVKAPARRKKKASA